MSIIEKYILYAIIFFLGYKYLKSIFKPREAQTRMRDVEKPAQVSSKMVRCASCQTYVPNDKASLYSPKRSPEFYLCSECEQQDSKVVRM